MFRGFNLSGQGTFTNCHKEDTGLVLFNYLDRELFGPLFLEGFCRYFMEVKLEAVPFQKIQVFFGELAPDTYCGGFLLVFLELFIEAVILC